jgi:hypothetical protein
MEDEPEPLPRPCRICRDPIGTLMPCRLCRALRGLRRLCAGPDKEE